jgi:hypothetical protein
MQFAKDTFYITLRDRLAAKNPERTLEVDGETRPALLVAENEAGDARQLCDAFVLRWGACEREGRSGPASVSCEIEFRTEGSTESDSLDRGRSLAGLQSELIAILQPPVTEKMDYSGTAAAGMGTQVFWSEPAFVEVEAEGAALRCKAKTRVYFFEEESL